MATLSFATGTIEVHEREGVVVVSLIGWIVNCSREIDELEAVLRGIVDREETQVVLNLGQARLGGVALLGLIGSAHMRLERRSRRLYVCKPHDEAFQRALHVTRLVELLHLYDSESEAVSAARAPR